MTLIELAWSLFHGVVGVVVGSLLWHRFGFLGGLAGFILGAVASFLVLWGSSKALDALAGRNPRRPRCRNGKCEWDDYRWQEDRNGGAVFRCACGDLYLHQGREFLLLGDDSEPIRYMKKSAFKGWLPEGEA